MILKKDSTSVCFFCCHLFGFIITFFIWCSAIETSKGWLILWFIPVPLRFDLIIFFVVDFSFIESAIVINQSFFYIESCWIRLHIRTAKTQNHSQQKHSDSLTARRGERMNAHSNCWVALLFCIRILIKTA